MHAYYLMREHDVLNMGMIIADEKDHQLYHLTTDGIRHSWCLKSFDQREAVFVFTHGFTQSSIKFEYLGRIYTVKRSALLSKYMISCDQLDDRCYRYMNGSYKSHFYINGVEQSYFDEDSNIISTKEKNTTFLLLVHLAVYIIMQVKGILT